LLLRSDSCLTCQRPVTLRFLLLLYRFADFLSVYESNYSLELKVRIADKFCAACRLKRTSLSSSGTDILDQLIHDISKCFIVEFIPFKAVVFIATKNVPQLYNRIGIHHAKLSADLTDLINGT